MSNIPAITIPAEISEMAFQYLIPNKKAIRQPVQPPLPGKGIETKIIRKIGPYLSMEFLCLLWACANIFVKNLLKNFEYRINNLEIGPKSHKIKKQGIIFPKTAQKKVTSAGNCRPKPIGIAILSSNTGSIAVKNTDNS